MSPFSTVDIFEGKMYIQTGKIKDVSKQLQEKSKEEIGAFCDSVWVRIACRLIRDENVKAKEHMLNAVATFRSFVSEPKTIRF